MRKALALILVSVMLLSLIAVGTSAATTVLAVEHNDGTDTDYLTEAQLSGFEFKDGDTLKITSDEFTGTLTIEVDDKNLTLTTANDSIVFAGNVVVENSDTFSSAIQTYGTLTIKDMQFNRTTTSSDDRVIDIVETTNVVIDNVVVNYNRTSGQSNATAIDISRNASETNLTINSSALTANGRTTVAVFVASANVTITSSALTSTRSGNDVITVKGSGSGAIAIAETLIETAGTVINADSDVQISVKDSVVNFDSSNNTIFVLSDADNASLYIYQTIIVIKNAKRIVKAADTSDVLIYSMYVGNSSDKDIPVCNKNYPFCIPSNMTMVPSNGIAIYLFPMMKEISSAAIVEIGSTGTADTKEVVSAACADLWAATTYDEIENIGNTAVAKIAAFEEIDDAIEGRTEEDVLELASAAIADVKAVATSSSAAGEIEAIKSAALAAINLLKAKHDAQNAVDEAAGSFDPFKAYVKLVAPNIWDKNTIAEVKDAEQTILNGINLLKEKFVAIKGLEPDRENEDEVIVEIASKAIADIVNAETSSAVAEIVSKAIADIEFEVYTNNAQADVAAEAEGETDKSIKDIESAAIAAIEDAATKAEIDEIKSQAIADIKLEKAKNAAQADVKAEADVENDEIKEIESNAIAAIEAAKTEEEIAGIKDEAIEAIKLVKAKIAAEAYINSSAALDTDARIKEVVSKAIADIWAQNKDADVEDVKSAAIAAILLAEDKVAAEEAINAEAGEEQSEDMKAIVSSGIADIWAQTNREDVELKKQAAIAAIQAQKVKEAPVTADNAIWYVVVATVAILGSAVVTKKVFF